LLRLKVEVIRIDITRTKKRPQTKRIIGKSRAVGPKNTVGKDDSRRQDYIH
jgi:hypothetical protein